MEDRQGRRLATVTEAAPLFGVEPKQLYYLIRERIVPPGVVVRLGRQIRINRERAREWIENGGRALDGGWRREREESP